MGKKICILTQSHLCRNPRVVKEANTLVRAGYEVTILTTFAYADLLEEDLKLIDPRVKLKGVVNLIPGETTKWYRLKERLRKRVAGELIARLGYENVFALGYDYKRNLKAAIREKADLYTCHQEVSTVIGCKLINKGFKAAFDFEDWYSHDLLPEANRSRPVKLLEKYEKIGLQKGAFSYTTSESLSGAFADFADAAAPGVLHNVFPLAERQLLDGRFLDRTDMEMPSIHWYSQTIGPGRGLEFLIDSLSEIKTPLQLHLRGNLFGNFQDQLLSVFPHHLGHKLFFHKLVPHKELLSRIAEHDIGLATEEYTPDSRNLTITNKILQYLLGGIAVLASDTAGQQEVARIAPESVFLFKNKDKESLVKVLNKLISDKIALKEAGKKALSTAENIFCWEKQEYKLLQWVENALKS